jgi:hypothetical protein
MGRELFGVVPFYNIQIRNLLALCLMLAFPQISMFFLLATLVATAAVVVMNSFAFPRK